MGREGGGERAGVAARVCEASSALILLLDSLTQEHLRRAATATRELPRVRREWLARPAHLPLRVHVAAWGHRRQEARRLCVLRRRRHLERKRRRYARHAARAPPFTLCARLRETAAAGKKSCGQALLLTQYTLENKHTLSYTRMLRTPYEQDPFRVRACARPPPLRGRAEPPPDPRLTSAPPPQRSRGSRARAPIKTEPSPAGSVRGRSYL